jgi:ferredoxin-NADP reductase
MPAWILAVASCVHVAFAMLRQHRSAPGMRRVSLVATGYAFAALPWVWPGAGAIAIGIATHLAWFAVSDPLATALHDARRPARRASVDENPSPRAASGVAAAAPRRPTVPRGFLPLTVLAVVDETPDIRTFRLARPEGFTFAAGQFLPVRIRVDGADRVRCYSISSAPHAGGFLEISVKRQGLVSSALHATLRPGSSLHARAPAGSFVYPDRDDRPLVLLAAGVGITPLMCMLRHAVHADPQRPVTLVQSARHVDGLAFADELRVLRRRHPHFQWVPAISGGAAPGDCYPGRIDAALLQMAAPGLAHSVTCICGPEGMIAATRADLAALGVPAAQVRFERFEAAVAAAGADAAPPEPMPADGESPVVTFARSRATVAAPTGQTLLDVAERSGIDIPSLCRAGICGTCRTRVTAGDVRCHSNTLAPDETADGFVLACVAHARTDCTVDA